MQMYLRSSLLLGRFSKCYLATSGSQLQLLHCSPTFCFCGQTLDQRGGRMNQRQLFTLKKTLHFKPRYKADGVPETHELIYENSQGPLLLISRVISNIGGGIGVALTTWYLTTYWASMETWKLYSLCGIGLFSSAAVVSVNIVTQYYLLRIYLDKQENTYIGVNHSLYGQLQRFDYSLQDIQFQPKIEDDRAINHKTHSKCTVKIKDNSFHLRATDFILPKYYNAHLKFP